jgi:hypothetical protein
MPPGTLIRPVSVGGESGGNVSVASLSTERQVAEGRERATISVRLVGRGMEGEATVPVRLEIDGQPVETREATLGEGGTGTVTFDPLTLPARGSARGVIRLPDDALAADNAFNFVLAADQRIGALIVEGPGTPPQASFYLQRALELGQAPGFRVETRRVGQLTSGDLADFGVVIFNQTPLPEGEIGRRMRGWVEGGAGMVFVMGDNGVGEWDGVLPDVGRRVDRGAEGGTTLGFVDMGHPVFEPFSTPRSGDFTAARVFQYRPISGGERVLARFGDGGTALSEQKVGKGRVLVWASSLDSGWNDLALQPVFLPFVHQLVKYAAGYAPAAPWRTVGDPFDPGATDPRAAPYTLALTPGGDRVALEGSRPLALEEPGFYELRDQRTGDRSAIVAVNVDPVEATTEAFDPSELVSTVSATNAVSPLADEALALTVEERERQQSAWWYLIVLAFLILAAETVLSNRYYRAAIPTRG